MTREDPVRFFGDGAVLVELGDLGAARRLAGLVTTAGDEPLAAVEDVVLGFGSVTVRFDPLRGDPRAVADTVAGLVARAHGTPATGTPPTGTPAAPDAEPVLGVDVCFDGPDLVDVAKTAGLEVPDVVALLADARLEVAFVGFAPGFAYLVGLPPELAAVPRRRRPRPQVPAGSVALGGGFAGIYPQASPGGWNLVGRTGAALFDPRRPPFALVAPGDRLRLRPVSEVVTSTTAHRLALQAPAGAPALVVEDPGTCTLVEDGGRRAVAHLGVPRAGAADVLALRLANRLVGNPERAAALEVTVRGPRLRARGDLHVAVVGEASRPGLVSLLVDGHPAPEAQVVPVHDGQVLEVGDTGGSVRAVVAVAGGVVTDALFGSRSCDLLSGLGPGPLRAGDEVALGVPGRPRAKLAWAGVTGHERLRLLPGPDVASGLLPTEVLEWVTATTWRTAPDSNRIGTRLVAESSAAHRLSAVVPGAPVAVTSRGMVAGAVQLPPEGELVVLGPDHATVGGYPVAAVLVSADLDRLAHLSPGDAVRFELAELADAVAALVRQEQSIDDAVAGWFPTRAG